MCLPSAAAESGNDSVITSRPSASSLMLRTCLSVAGNSRGLGSTLSRAKSVVTASRAAESSCSAPVTCARTTSKLSLYPCSAIQPAATATSATITRIHFMTASRYAAHGGLQHALQQLAHLRGIARDLDAARLHHRELLLRGAL